MTHKKGCCEQEKGEKDEDGKKRRVINGNISKHDRELYLSQNYISGKDENTYIL